MKHFIILSLLAIFMSGCATVSNNTSNTKALENSDFSQLDKIVLVPIKITVKESGIGSLEKLPEESEMATKVVLSELKDAFARNNIEVVDFIPQNHDEQALVDEYIGLYHRVAGEAQSVNYRGNAWKHKANDYSDYSLGEGLAFIKNATNADKALFVFGEDIVTSGGKKALAVLAMIGGIGVNPGGVAVLHVGIVDLNDGSLVWSNSSASQGLSLDENKSVSKAIGEIILNSPITAGE